MVNSVESETKNRYELMTRVLPDAEFNGQKRTVAREMEELKMQEQMLDDLEKRILALERYYGISK